MKIFLGRKRLQYYGDLLIKADLGLHEQIAEQITRSLPSGSSILDFGAGEGALSARLVDLGYRVTAADKDAASFRCDRAVFAQVDFDMPDAVDRFVASHQECFDAVLGVEVIEHVHDRWRYVTGLLSMTRPGGLILVTTPNIASWLSRLIFLFTGRYHQFGDADLAYGHVNPLTPSDLTLVLRECGAEHISLTSGGTLPPVYLTGLNKLALLNPMAWILRPLMRSPTPGLLDGWCVIATARKSQTSARAPASDFPGASRSA